MKTTIQNRLKEKIKEMGLFVISMFSISNLFFYSLPFPMINLWDLFVEYMFGSFWLAVFFIALIYFIILMLGGVSYYTVIIFMLYYFTAMSIGYGYPLITVAVAVFALVYMLYQIFRVLENR